MICDKIIPSKEYMPLACLIKINNTVYFHKERLKKFYLNFRDIFDIFPNVDGEISFNYECNYTLKEFREMVSMSKDKNNEFFTGKTSIFLSRLFLSFRHIQNIEAFAVLRMEDYKNPDIDNYDFNNWYYLINPKSERIKYIKQYLSGMEIPKSKVIHVDNLDMFCGLNPSFEDYLDENKEALMQEFVNTL